MAAKDSFNIDVNVGDHVIAIAPHTGAFFPIVCEVVGVTTRSVTAHLTVNKWGQYVSPFTKFNYDIETRPIILKRFIKANDDQIQAARETNRLYPRVDI